jgi:hypothetical protein
VGEPQIVVSDVLDAADAPIEGVRELVMPTELLERGISMFLFLLCPCVNRLVSPRRQLCL